VAEAKFGRDCSVAEKIKKLFSHPLSSRPTWRDPFSLYASKGFLRFGRNDKFKIPPLTSPPGGGEVKFLFTFCILPFILSPCLDTVNGIQLNTRKH